MVMPANNEPSLSSQTMFEGRIIKVRVDTVQLVNGGTATREIAEHAASVCVAPVDEEGNALLVRQYRKPAEAFLLEAPAGNIEAGEEPEAAAQRELREETGYAAGVLRRLTGFWLAPGWCTEYMYAYLATGLTPSRLSSDDDEFIDLERVPLSEVEGLIEDGTIQDAKSVAALLLAIRILRDN